jgi:hypothetical protein
MNHYLEGYKACENWIIKGGREPINPHKKGGREYEQWKRGFETCWDGED